MFVHPALLGAVIILWFGGVAQWLGRQSLAIGLSPPLEPELWLRGDPFVGKLISHLSFLSLLGR